jgi:hypothetical protein
VAPAAPGRAALARWRERLARALSPQGLSRAARALTWQRCAAALALLTLGLGVDLLLFGSREAQDAGRAATRSEDAAAPQPLDLEPWEREALSALGLLEGAEERWAGEARPEAPAEAAAPEGGRAPRAQPTRRATPPAARAPQRAGADLPARRAPAEPAADAKAEPETPPRGRGWVIRR